jgi:hypothetical protein
MTSKFSLCIVAVLIAFAFAIELAAQQQNVTVQSAAPPAVVTVPDGTEIPLILEKSLSSAGAKAGDSVQFKVASPVLAERFVLVPQGTAVSGTIVQVRQRGHFGKNGEINIAIKDIVLPVGKSVSVRQTLEPSEHKHTSGKATGEVGRAVVESIPFFGVTLPMIAVAKGLQKGTEQVVLAGDSITVYMNGPITVDRSVLMRLPYRGPAQIFFKNGGCLNEEDCDKVNVFLGKYFIAELFGFLRVELEPGTYSFNTDKTEKPLEIELLADHQYWVERQHGALFADDPEHHRDEIKKLEGNLGTKDKNLVLTR